ncbi:ROK family protein [Pseudoxanthomonas daejeonensis]|nr:ROK family protein [Pseudoxanthomonas daejeonensis]UNK57234.1 ROK family protein [Pseudoxanthomonas daejeonensis]
MHGASRLPGLRIDHYNLLVPDPDGEGFLGDRASQTAFRELLETARQHHRTGKDPFGKTPSTELGKKEIDLVLVGGDPDAAHLVHLAVEEYARRLVHVVQVFLAQPQWKGVEKIVLGGGFPDHEAGGLATRRAVCLLEHADVDVSLHPLRHDADEGGLLGWVPLLPRTHRDRAAFLAVDVGGTNIRCGIVEHRLGKHPDGGKARVLEVLKWRHADDAPSRNEAVIRLAAMLNGLTAQARTRGIDLAPFVGVACPGQVEADGTLSHGAQNLPGDWEQPFKLPEALAAHLDPIDGNPPQVVLHNDAVVQGLSEHRRMRKTRRWAVLTIGTGLGNASYSNR